MVRKACILFSSMNKLFIVGRPIPPLPHLFFYPSSLFFSSKSFVFLRVPDGGLFVDFISFVFLFLFHFFLQVFALQS